MYELTVSVDNNQPHFINYLESNLRPVLAKIDGVIATDSGKQNQYLTVACSDTFRVHLSNTVSALVADVLAVGYKRMYLCDNLHIVNKNFYTSTLVNTMSIFDNSSDKEFLRKIVDVRGGECCLSGYYNFRMGKLKERWADLVRLANGNADVMSDVELIKEFLAYLRDTLAVSVDTLSVVIGDNDFQLFDTKGSLIRPLALFAPECSQEECAIVNILCLRPKRVKLYCDTDSVDKNFVQLVSYLFDTKVIQNS